jgi:diacylglycerol kinase (ATP)
MGNASHDKSADGLARLIRSLRYSAAGFRYAFAEVAVRQVTGAIAILVPVAAFMPVPRLEQLLLVLPLMLVFFAEVLNSAIEATVDRVSEEPHPLARRAKDLASAAVVVTVLMAGFSWSVIAGPVVWRWLQGATT